MADTFKDKKTEGDRPGDVGLKVQIPNSDQITASRPGIGVSKLKTIQ